MSTNYNQDSYKIPINPPTIGEEGSTPSKDCQEDYTYNKTPTYNSSHSSAPPTALNEKDKEQPFSNIDTTKSPVSFHQTIPKCTLIRTIILNIFLFSIGISDIIMQIKIKYFNIFNFIDDIILLMISIIFTYYTIKNKNLPGCSIIISIGEGYIGFALRVIGLIKCSKKVNSNQIPDYYLLLNGFFIFIDTLIFIHHIILPCTY